jgi:hypothetical protein
MFAAFLALAGAEPTAGAGCPEGVSQVVAFCGLVTGREFRLHGVDEAEGCSEVLSPQQAIVVCGVRGGRSRFRLVPRDIAFDPRGNVRSVASERARWGEGGEMGTGSCSAVGPGGFTGCLAKGWRDSRRQEGWYN